MVRLGIVLTAMGLVGFAACAAAADEPAVDFLRDVKPILAQRCYRCHS